MPASRAEYIDAAEGEIRAAEKCLTGTTRYFNGGQTRADYDPSDSKIAEAAVHASLANAYAKLADFGSQVSSRE